MGALINLTGSQFGRLVVLGRAAGFKGVFWVCECSCGNLTSVRTGHLRNGHTSSCGCLHTDQLRSRSTTHGKSHTKAYNAWLNAIRRCHNEDHKRFYDYGGRGIKVCARWLVFENFLSDMGEPEAGQSLDRIDNNGNYEPGNCRWATRFEQARNRRCTLTLTFQGVTRSASEWSQVLGLAYQTILSRLSKGWAVEKVLATKKFTRHRSHEYA